MFNHDATSQQDALNIRRNHRTEVSVPEWTLGCTDPEQSPAAYSIRAVEGNKIIIKVQLRLVPEQDGTFSVRALGGGVLGEATRDQPVTFFNGRTVPDFIPFDLKAHRVGADGILIDDIDWTWQYQVPGEAAWRDIGPTSHRIYAVLREPQPAWHQAPYPDPQNPWTEVLDYACVWARGAKTEQEAAGKVTAEINRPAGNVVYDMANGRCHYTSIPDESPGRFDCTAYLDRLRRGTGSPSCTLVNCCDCATMTSTFANALGCDLEQSVMGFEFDLNPIVAIGQTDFGAPDWGPGFSYHEVAWHGQAAFADPIWDACLKTSQNGASPPPVPVLPVNSVFQQPYRPQLVHPFSTDSCLPRPQYIKRRIPI